MSSVQVPLNKIIIGTASWGSKISYNDAHQIANKLINNGFNQFDTAQNYGSGYSQDINARIQHEQDHEQEVADRMHSTNQTAYC